MVEMYCVWQWVWMCFVVDDQCGQVGCCDEVCCQCIDWVVFDDYDIIIGCCGYCVKFLEQDLVELYCMMV